MASPLLLLLLLLPFSGAGAATVSTTIHAACRATRFPSICEKTLSESPSLPQNPSPTDLILAAINASSSGTTTALTLSHSILSSSSDPNHTTAARNCIDLLTLASHRLSSISSPSSSARLSSARAWTSAVLLYHYSCWSALKYVNTTSQISSAMAFLTDLQSITSNALSMLFSLHRFGPDLSLWSPPQTERDGYWDSSSSSGAATGADFGSGSTLLSRSKPDVMVCKGGSCRFDSVQAAVDSAPVNRTERFVIYIKEGVYNETVRVPFEKPNLAFVGDGMGKTVITGSLSADMVGVSTYNTATVGVQGDGFMAYNLTISNTAGPDAHQAVAYRSDSDLSILDSVELSGHQDTLYAASLRQYFKSCTISGTVDFIFGNSASFFDNCLILTLPRQLNPDHGETNTVTAHGRTDPAQTTGFVFHRSTINGSADYLRLFNTNPKIHRTYLGRPWKEFSRTVFLECYLERVVRPEGWSLWDGDFALSTLFYGEFASVGPGANVSARVPWSSQVPPEHVDVYSVSNFIQGDQWIHSLVLNPI
ncbi:Pectinesterase protein [Dioscorea alata]|uniref:Pectinesterase protein n=1 Tax=Dioscorea alata TaxID=55571 RepID=A0ACB7VQP8_DIOAL|nr:Pectinesterase protein [Dioscorea alata]